MQVSSRVWDKARRLYHGNAVDADPGGYTVTGDHDTYRVAEFGWGEWNCTCPYHSTCSHIVAAMIWETHDTEGLTDA